MPQAQSLDITVGAMVLLGQAPVTPNTPVPALVFACASMCCCLTQSHPGSHTYPLVLCLVQPTLPVDRAYIHAEWCCCLVSCNLSPPLALKFTSRNCSPAEECPQFSYQACYQCQNLYLPKRIVVQPDMTCTRFQLLPMNATVKPS